MSRSIFVNLPVRDLQKSVDFFSSLGFAFNAQFTDEKAACMIISDKAFVMLLTEPFFQGFIIVTVGCHVGLRTRGGTAGVGRATTNAVVTASVGVIAMDFFSTQLLLSMLF